MITGAGDAFAGGFMASMLSTRLLIYQPLPINIGAIAALARMKSRNEPFFNISNDTRAYLSDLRKDEIHNFKQILCLFIEKLKKQLSVFFIGIITGVIGSLIVWWIQSLYNLGM